MNEILTQSPFFKVLADVNEANEVHEAAADCAIALLEALEPLNPSQEQWSAQLELAVFGVVKNLESPYLMSVASEDIVKAINFCRVFTELGESLLYRIVHNSSPQTPYFATSVFESILTCCGHPGSVQQSLLLLTVSQVLLYAATF